MSETTGRAGAADPLDPAVEPDDGSPDHSPRAVLRYPAFRRLWLVLGLSSFGDWLGLLAITFFAAVLAGTAADATVDLGDLGAVDLGVPEVGLAVSLVFVLRLAPALVLGPLAGVLADRVDRRTALVVGDVVRGALFLSIPLVGELWWLYVATVLVEITALFWMPAKDALVPNLVPRRRLEAANQLGVIATYGSAPLAALAFVVLVWLSNLLDGLVGGFASVVASPVDLALYVNAATFLVAAAVVARLPLPPGARGPALGAGADGPQRASVWRQVVEGWAFIARTPVVRGLVGGMIGAFAAGGFVIGLGIPYVAGLGAGAPGYGVLFGAVFIGMALGVWQGPRTLRDVSRRRLFAASIAAAGVVLVLVGLSPELVLSVVLALLLGFCAGLAWVTGMTLLGGEVDDVVRGRTFAFVQTAVRVVLVAVMAAGPALAALLGTVELAVSDDLVWRLGGPGLVLTAAGLLAVVVGAVTFRQLDDRPGLSLRRELVEAVRRGAGDPFEVQRSHPGFFLVVEGGDGAGKSTLTAALREWLVGELGHDVVLTREPGGTPLGRQVRGLVLDWDDEAQGPGPVPRAEALLFAADRAQHVATVVRPALEAGHVVIGDRYVDSSIAYQGARGDLDPADVERVSRWATENLRPDLTVLLDLDPGAARERLHGRDGVQGADRLESAGDGFHDRVRAAFLERAAADPRRYLVVDAGLPAEEVLDLVVARVRRAVPLSAHQRRVMAERLAADARHREQREAAAVEAAEQEDAERAVVRERLAEQQAAQEQREREELAERARLVRAEAEQRRAELRDGETAVLPVVGAEGPADAPADGGTYEDGYTTYEDFGTQEDLTGDDGRYAYDGYGRDDGADDVQDDDGADGPQVPDPRAVEQDQPRVVQLPHDTDEVRRPGTGR